MGEEALVRKILANELEDSLLQYKQMELNSLLEVTKAINMNSSAENLFKIYGFILQAQMKVNRLIVFHKVEDEWRMMHKIGVQKIPEEWMIVPEEWMKIEETLKLKNTDLPLKSYFDYLMPIYHKDKPLTFVLLGKLEKYLNDTLDNRLNFIRTITNIIVVAIENKRLFRKQIEQERLNREMELAAKVQNMLVPSCLPNNEQHSLDAIYMPHFNIGGDYYDVVEISENETLVCIADVSGKGISAALLMANFQAMLRVLAKDGALALDELVQKLNERVEEITKGERFLTFFVAKYYSDQRKLEYINAGHPPPILYNCETPRDQTQLKVGTTIIGAFKDLPFVQMGTVENVPEESNIVMFTDGLTELANEEGDFFEQENLEAFIEEQQVHDCKVFNENLMKNINHFKGERFFSDDISVVCWKIY